MKLLVVVDMQKDFVDGALGSAEAQAIVAEAERRSARIHADADEYWNMMRSRVQGLLQNN